MTLPGSGHGPVGHQASRHAPILGGGGRREEEEEEERGGRRRRRRRRRVLTTVDGILQY